MTTLGSFDFSVIADRVPRETWIIYQAIKAKLRGLRGVTLRINFDRYSMEPETTFYYKNRILMHIKTEDKKSVTVVFNADTRTRNRLAQDETLSQEIRDNILRKPWAAFSVQSVKELGPILDLARAKCRLINEDETGVTLEIVGEPTRRTIDSPRAIQSTEPIAASPLVIQPQSGRAKTTPP